MRWILLLLGVVYSLPSLAMYCGQKLVTEGDKMYSVLERCGEPAFKTSRQEIIKRPCPGKEMHIPEIPACVIYTTINIDEWTYNFGPTQFLKILTFRNSKLVEIKTGERGD